MTARRYAMQPTKSPTLTRGDDHDETPCQRDLRLRLTIARAYGRRMDPTPFDVLTDIAGEQRHALTAARREAIELCGTCPVRDACWREHQDEEWLQRLANRKRHNPTVERDTCGTWPGYLIHMRGREKACEACAEASRARSRKRRRPTAKCGTDSGYYRHIRGSKTEPKTEPCDACRKAHAKANRKAAA